MPRSIWKGSISFGLVNIPVELFSAVRDHRPRFRLLHAKDEAPVRYERVCQTEGKPVGWEELVKGYEYEKGQFVVLTKDDFKTAALQKTKTVDILDFVDPTEIDDRYFETPYYMTPGKGAARSYALLREAIRDSKKMGIGKIILRETQHLAAIEVIGDALVLTMMRFSDELADLGEFSFPSSEGLRKPELSMARQLVDNLSAGWDPGKYTDEYVKNLMRIIDAKLKGRKPKLEARKTRQPADVVDLMARLKASLEARPKGETPRRTQASKRKGSSRPRSKRVA
jgi:DNA end-binding protein Ku